MSKAELLEWDRKYSRGEYKPREYPSPLLTAWLPRLHPGRALDLACGWGRNALFLAEQGYIVDAVDISRTALSQARSRARERGLNINWIQADLDTYALPRDTYHVIINSFYINRNLVPRIKEALRDGGVLLFEHHFLTPEPVDGPQNPDFRLRSNELLHLFWDLRVLFYEEGIFQEGEHRRAISRLVAQKSGPGTSP